jgi:hypothetical protein
MEKLISDQVFRALRACEACLLEAIVAGAKEGDYETIDLARVAAEEIHALQARLTAQLPKEAPPDDNSRKVPESRRDNARKPTKTRKKYPRFEVEDSTLLRVGWSKKRKAEYTQRIPMDSFESIVGGFADTAAAAEGPVSSDVILERIEEAVGDVPTYQTYGVLKFLRDHEVIRQASRGEYAIPRDVASRARAIWKNVASRGR